MICYICANPAEHSIRVHDEITFSYCDNHISEVVLGISEYALKGSLDKLEKAKAEYNAKGAGTSEFEKCKNIEKYLEGEDFGLEQTL
jgi:hypothetical protein